MTKYLAWISGLRGTEAQLWYDKPVDGNGRAKKYLSLHQIDDNDKRDLDRLKLVYPAPDNEAKS